MLRQNLWLPPIKRSRPFTRPLWFSLAILLTASAPTFAFDCSKWLGPQRGPNPNRDIWAKIDKASRARNIIYAEAARALEELHKGFAPGQQVNFMFPTDLRTREFLIPVLTPIVPGLQQQIAAAASKSNKSSYRAIHQDPNLPAWFDEYDNLNTSFVMSEEFHKAMSSPASIAELLIASRRPKVAVAIEDLRRTNQATLKSTPEERGAVAIGVFNQLAFSGVYLEIHQDAKVVAGSMLSWRSLDVQSWPEEYYSQFQKIQVRVLKRPITPDPDCEKKFTFYMSPPSTNYGERLLRDELLQKCTSTIDLDMSKDIRIESL